MATFIGVVIIIIIRVDVFFCYENDINNISNSGNNDNENTNDYSNTSNEKDDVIL